MFLTYPNKKAENEILNLGLNSTFKVRTEGVDNYLIHSENLEALLYLQKNFKSSIDLVYIDPPFATDNIFTVGDGRSNTISNKKHGAIAYSDNLTGFEFIEFIRERLILLRELLSDKGSIYLHIDYKIGHYVKIIMDEIFGAENFRNDISRIKCNPKNFSRKAYGNQKDMILFYSKTKDIIWNEPRQDYSEEDIIRLFDKVDSEGKRYTTVPVHAPGETLNGDTGMPWKGISPPKGRHWRVSPSELDKLDALGRIEWSRNGVPRKIDYPENRKGMKRQDIWEYKDSQSPAYPTEKNLKMLEMIINASSNPDSLVLDCFAGSGSTLEAAHNTKRKWIGIDQSDIAINVIKSRLQRIPIDLFTQQPKYTFIEQDISQGKVETKDLKLA